jgi:hypothetical protein
LTDRIDSKITNDTLIDNRGVYVPIGNDNFSTFQSRFNPCVGVVKPICCKETSLLKRSFVPDFDGFQSEPSEVTVTAWFVGLMNFIERVLG